MNRPDAACVMTGKMFSKSLNLLNKQLFVSLRQLELDSSDLVLKKIFSWKEILLTSSHSYFPLFKALHESSKQQQQQQ